MSYSIITRTFVVYGSLCYFLFLLLYESVLVTVGLSSLLYNSSLVSLFIAQVQLLKPTVTNTDS